MRAALGCALAIAAVAACAMKSPHSSPPERPPGDQPEPPVAVLDPGPRREIAARAEQIRQWRLDAQLDGEPAPEAVRAMSVVAVADAAGTCAAPPAAGACRDVCSLGDSICDSAEAICGLAEQLVGDAWAAEKCDSAKASCRDAEERCCTCRQPDLGTP